MVVVPAGSFTMGSPENEAGHHETESPQHVVTIEEPFAVARLHVTVDQLAAFVQETQYDTGSKCATSDGEDGVRSWRNPGFAQDGSHPVVCLNWNDARAYVAWLAQKTGKPYRLLTEAEWEYAARGRTQPGTYPRFWFGSNDEASLCRYGNGRDQKGVAATPLSSPPAPCDDGYAYTSPVGRYEPNAFGLFDMFGNAAQVTADCMHDNYTGAPDDGSAWISGSFILWLWTAPGDCRLHIIRGGAWDAAPSGLRAASRDIAGTVRSSNTGVRVARTLQP
jgi:formylglycine-generating enzyme required for sulfatase activity